ncbi:response regulator [Paenibacillus sp. Y412MC10]|uniref:response regulator n=1 Tax=Geobacillus sp. (strain Y412MC10) TaxID=481743 RepID=UPI001642FB18|nr:response regulator [Paenibacillus sp. Y412MC10]
MKVLIADDDVYTREGLVEAIEWERLGIQEILQAEDGSQALQLAAAHRPDIVITDVRMPKLNGIEFAERLSAVCPDSKLLFISGYMEVAYMKSAIRLAAVDYVEKPIKLQELEKAIGRTIGYVRERREREILLGQKVDIDRRKLAIALRTGGHNQETIRELCKDAGFPTDTCYISIIISYGEENIVEPSIALQNDWEVYRDAALTEQLDQQKQFLLIALGNRNERGRVLHLAEQLSRRRLDVRIGVGSVVSNLLEVPRSFQESVLALEAGFYRPESIIVTFDPNLFGQHAVTGEAYLEFHHCLKHKPQELLVWMESYCDRLLAGPYMLKEGVVSLFASFAQAMLNDKNGMLLRSGGRVYQIRETERHLNQCRTMQEVKEYILGMCLAYQEEVKEISIYSSVIRAVMTYISAHCNHPDLDVREIADHVHLSTAHLGVLFKQETGTTIKQYVNDYRLELAKRLVAGEYFKMADISKMCGYASPGYFAKVFKSSTGLTPIEYRKQRSG